MSSRFKTLVSGLPLFWRLQISAWTGLFIYGCFSRTGHYDHVAMGAGMSLLLEPTEFIFSSGLRWVYRRMNLHKGFTARAIWVILLGSIVAMLLQLVVANYGAPVVARLAEYKARPSPLITRVTYFMMMYVGWSVAYVWLKSQFYAQEQRERLAEARAAAQRAELQMLRLQLNPHFMFNSLNNIATQIPDQPDTALEMTHDLADFLRYSLDQHGGLIRPLAHEVEVMTTYLKIEKLRFGDRLQYSVEVDAAARTVPVPSFLLQPLAENAVKHGLNSAEPPWLLDVCVKFSGGQLVIQMSNSGRLEPDWATKADIGIGVANLRRRLALHYPARHRFELRQEGALVCAEIMLEGEPCPV